MSQGCGNAALSCFSQSLRETVENYTAQNHPQPGRPRRHTGRLCSCRVREFLSGCGALVTTVFFSASWQWGDPCLPRPDKNSSTSVRREPNIGVRRSRTTMGDRCISMPTMFSVPGGTPVGGDCLGFSLGWLSGNSFSTERVPLGVWGTECPHINRQAGRRPARQRGGGAAHKPASQRPPIPTRPREPLQRG